MYGKWSKCTYEVLMKGQPIGKSFLIFMDCDNPEEVIDRSINSIISDFPDYEHKEIRDGSGKIQEIKFQRPGSSLTTGFRNFVADPQDYTDDELINLGILNCTAVKAVSMA